MKQQVCCWRYRIETGATRTIGTVTSHLRTSVVDMRTTIKSTDERGEADKTGDTRADISHDAVVA